MIGTAFDVSRTVACLGLRAVTAMTALTLSGCCEESTEPCVSWIAMNETYEIEILDRFELDKNATPADDPSPYDGYSRGQQTCGEGFDLSPGDRLSMTAIGTQQALSGQQRRCDACLYIDANASIDGVERLSDDRRGYGIADARFADMFEAAVDEECRGSYWMGVMPVGDYFIANTERHVATDYMLFREFYEEDTEACRRPGSKISEAAPGCWDSWVVRIRDSSGQLKTRELHEAEVRMSVDGGANE